MWFEGVVSQCTGKGVRKFQNVRVGGKLHPSWGHPLGVVIYRLSSGYCRGLRGVFEKVL